MRDGFPILDADRHVIEPYELWDEYLDPEFRADAPRLLPFGADPGLSPMLAVDGKPIYRQMSREAWAAIGRAAAARVFAGPIGLAETQLAHMDVEGIDRAVLYPTFALLIEGMETLKPARAAAYARAYNRWLLDFCARDPERLLGIGLVSIHAPEAMSREVVRVAAHGWRGVVLRPNPAQQRRLSDEAYGRFWATCEDLSLAVVVHEGTHAYLPATGADRFSTRFAQHACSHPMEQMVALLDLIEGGVFERHPRLRVAFLEAGCGWVPYWLWRLDDEYAHLASEVSQRVRMLPSEYFRRQGWVAAEPDEPYLAPLLGFVGADRILFGTDFPHVDHDDGLVARALARRSSLPDAVLRDYLWHNGARLFGLPSSGLDHATAEPGDVPSGDGR